ncbi:MULTISPECIES: gephyrin-like molybdotransferase Glp [unclassified Streptomyces]|uniref:molybdotransferase-like divisome protein Glp n=1 Tax=unclassified Streptomyces TaxID=2593676 RepID=UPI000360B173|nr:MULTISPECIES: gephyrin-like molybdotransferase Glp [unclassified Streptomyces]MYT30999.1 molybdopterin molybdenumtransferase MoeA [Streptomyces sp. SID8354]
MNGSTDRTSHPDRVWSVAEHLDDILARLSPPAPVTRQLLDAQGCVLADDLTVPLPLPPFDNSSMDGYAVRAADVADAAEDAPATLTVLGDVAAGSGEPPTVGPGQAARIMTGAPVPPGADAVVPVEWTDGGTGRGPAATMRAHSAAPQDAGGEVRVHRPAAAGAHIRRTGSDAKAGEPALPAGTVLGPTQLGLLAALGLDTVTVRRRPRVVVLSTGSELVPPGEPLGPGQIHDSNSFQLTAAARAAGALAYRVGAVADDAKTLRAALEDQYPRADVLVTSGGVSVGAYDVVKETLSGLAADEGRVEFRRLAMQPGKPQGFGLIGPDRIPLLALPGNPVSSYVSFELFVRPVIRTLMGHPEVHRRTARARLTEPLGSSPRGRRQFLRGTHDPVAGTVTPVGGSGSHLIRAMARADALIVVPEDTTDLPADATVEVIPLDPC